MNAAGALSSPCAIVSRYLQLAARDEAAELLERRGPHLGVFRDDEALIELEATDQNAGRDR